MGQITLLAIVNPLSGTASRKEKQRWVDRLLKEADQAGFTPEAVFTDYAGHATVLATDAVRQGVSRVVAIGGDGTVNETGQALLHSRTALGIVPVGSGNGLARHLGVPLNPLRAMERVLAGKPALIDTGKINDHTFLCTAGTGFEAYVADRFARQPVRGLPSYLKTAYRAYWGYKPAVYEIDGQANAYFSLTVANAGQFGNNAWIAPKANISDGLLDLCLLRPFPGRMVGTLAWRLFNKTLDRSPFLEVRPHRSATITAEEPLLIHIDGEPLQLKTSVLTVQVVPSSLLVIL